MILWIGKVWNLALSASIPSVLDDDSKTMCVLLLKNGLTPKKMKECNAAVKFKMAHHDKVTAMKKFDNEADADEFISKYSTTHEAAPTARAATAEDETQKKLRAKMSAR